MPSRNVGGDRQAMRTEADRRIVRRRVVEQVQSISSAAITTRMKADYPSDHPMESSGGASLGAKELGAVGHAVSVDASDDRAASTFLARLDSGRITPEQDAKIHAVGQLAGCAAHDFNNIFTVIFGNLQLIQRRTDGNTRLQEMVVAGIEASLRGKDLANRLLALSQCRQLELQVIDANTQLIGMKKILGRTVGKRIEIRTRLADTLWKVETDPAMLEAAIINLAINAREAMPEGGALTIETANIASNGAAIRPSFLRRGPYVRISVGDSGCGMAPDVLERIVEPFFTTKLPRSHVGLGLNMISAFVEQSQGQLTVDSVPGKGTWFNMYLRAVITPAASATAVGGNPDAGNPGELA